MSGRRLFLNFIRRARRYSVTWLWLIRAVVKTELKLFISTILFGVVARLGTLVGFIVIIKAAIWILNPTTIPAVLYSTTNLSHSSVLLILVIAPGSVFLIKALAQTVHSRHSLMLRTSVANRLVVGAAHKVFANNDPQYFTDKTKSALVASDLKTNYTKLFVIQTLLNSAIILSFVFVLSLLIGLLLDWKIVTILMSFLTLLAIVFINYKHKKSLELTANLVEMKDKETMSIRAFVADLTDVESWNDDGRNKENLQTISNNVGEIQFFAQKFEANSQLFMDVGQAVMMVTFLSLLIGQEGDGGRLTQLALLAVLFRFLINYMQAIVQSVIKLSPYYSFLKDLKKELWKENITS